MLPTNPYNFVNIEADVQAIVAGARRRKDLEDLLESRELMGYDAASVASFLPTHVAHNNVL